MSMTLRERLEWLSRMALLVFILASAAFLSAITAMRIAIHGREVTMPNLVGKNVSEANQLLRSRGLVLRVADRVYSEQPTNVVVRQTPTAGLLMKVSQQAHVVLSLGQRQLDDSAAGRSYAENFAHRDAARRIADWRSFEYYDAGQGAGHGGDSESQAGDGSGDAASGCAGVAGRPR